MDARITYSPIRYSYRRFRLLCKCAQLRVMWDVTSYVAISFSLFVRWLRRMHSKFLRNPQFLHDANGWIRFDFLLQVFVNHFFSIAKCFNRNQNPPKELKIPPKMNMSELRFYFFAADQFHWMNPKAAACIRIAIRMHVLTRHSRIAVNQSLLVTCMCIRARFTYYMHLHKNQDVESRYIQLAYNDGGRGSVCRMCVCASRHRASKIVNSFICTWRINMNKRVTRSQPHNNNKNRGPETFF